MERPKTSESREERAVEDFRTRRFYCPKLGYIELQYFTIEGIEELIKERTDWLRSVKLNKYGAWYNVDRYYLQVRRLTELLDMKYNEMYGSFTYID